jgi:hypothetical protein
MSEISRKHGKYPQEIYSGENDIRKAIVVECLIIKERDDD